MNRRDRAVIVRVLRWARKQGWQSTYRGWMSPGQRTCVAVEMSDECATVWVHRRNPRTRLWELARRFEAKDAWEAVDLLYAVRVLPPELCSAYQVGYANGLLEAVTP